jgi:hypothetical protein
MLTTSEPERPDAAPAAAAAAPGRLARPAWLPGRWLAVAAWAVAGVVLFAAYLLQARTSGASSNSAGQALQAWDMLHGNVLLRGWSLSDVSFYTTELPEYMLVELARGLNGSVVHVAAALGYMLVVLLGAILAKGRKAGREGLARLAVAGGIMLTPSLAIGTYLMLSGPDHIGSQVPLLIIWLLLDRAEPRWWVPVAVAVLLTCAQVADMIVLIEGVLPLVFVCAVRMLRRRGPVAGQWYELSLAAGALGAAVAARVVLALIRQAGGFFVVTPLAKFSLRYATGAELWHKIRSLLDAFGASFSPPSPVTVFAAMLHLLGVVLVAWAVAAAVRRFLSDLDLTTQILAVAFTGLLVAYVFGNKPDANEIVGLLPMGAVLAGRLLGGRLIKAGLIRPLAAVLAGLSLMLGYNASRPAPAEQHALTSWLQAHHLTYGLAGYWQANILTVDSGGSVQIRPVRMYSHQLVTTPDESDATWYDPSRHDASFVIWTPPPACLNVCLSMADLRKIYGPPAVIYRVGIYRVLLWHQNLLTRLPTMSFCGRGWPWAIGIKPAPAPCPENLLRI